MCSNAVSIERLCKVIQGHEWWQLYRKLHNSFWQLCLVPSSYWVLTSWMAQTQTHNFKRPEEHQEIMTIKFNSSIWTLRVDRIMLHVITFICVVSFVSIYSDCKWRQMRLVGDEEGGVPNFPASMRASLSFYMLSASRFCKMSRCLNVWWCVRLPVLAQHGPKTHIAKQQYV
jgi:hypothetical protein